jgi:hypothetical protein
VTLVAAAEERDVALELGQEAHQLLRQRGDRRLVPFPALVDLADADPVLGVIIPPPEDMVPKRFGDQALHQVGVLGAGAEEPGGEGFVGAVRHRRSGKV